MKNQKKDLITKHAKLCKKCSEICTGGLVACPPKFLVKDNGGVSLALPPVEIRAYNAAAAARKWAQYVGLRETPANVEVVNESGRAKRFRIVPILEVRYTITGEGDA